LDLRDLDATILDLALNLTPQRDGLLAGFDLARAADRGARALRIGQNPFALSSCGSYARPRSCQQKDRGPKSPEDDSDERCAGREHAASGGGMSAHGRWSPWVLSHDATCTGRAELVPGPYLRWSNTLRLGAAGDPGSGSSKFAGSWIQKAHACRKNIE